jgi:hypothetical protein
VAWKILRGAVVASTEIVMFGGVADQAEIDKTRTLNTPKTLESFILWAPIAVMNYPNSRSRIYDYSSQ